MVRVAATEEAEAEAATGKVSIPQLPSDALVISSPGDATWMLEKKEFASIAAGGNEVQEPTPHNPYTRCTRYTRDPLHPVAPPTHPQPTPARPLQLYAGGGGAAEFCAGA